MLFNKLDLRLDEYGNLTVANGDLARNSSAASLKETIKWRLETSSREWRAYNPLVLGGVTEYYGRGNTAETAAEIQSRIERALTSDGLIAEGDLHVRIVPTSEQQISIYIVVRNFRAFDFSTDNLTFVFVFDYENASIVALDGSID